jgi:hypothetical protein
VQCSLKTVPDFGWFCNSLVLHGYGMTILAELADTPNNTWTSPDKYGTLLKMRLTIKLAGSKWAWKFVCLGDLD